MKGLIDGLSEQYIMITTRRYSASFSRGSVFVRPKTVKLAGSAFPTTERLA